MEPQSNLVESQRGKLAGVPRISRRPYRQKIRTLAHVNIDTANGAILRDLSEFGIAMQTVTPLTPDQPVQVRFDLPSPKLRIEAAGRIAWTDSWGQAGVQFVDLPERSQRLLKEWVFIQILSAAYLFAPCESAAVKGNHAEGATELLFSASPRPAIPLEPPVAAPILLPRPEPQRVRLHWCPIPISLNALSKMLDGLILLCAVLLFAVMTMVITDVLPTWLVTLPLAIAVTAIFVGLYWFLFVFWFSSTPGEHLARMACLESGMYGEEEDHPRFR
jgi:PilZ domain-containing protein